MEARTAPSFNTAIRGYDREEVDEYVDSLAKALEDLEESEERARKLQQHLTRLNARIHELEDRIKTETPRTTGALGERISLLLSAAEAGAEEAIRRAETEAREIVARAEADVVAQRAKIASDRADADQVVRTATDRAEAQARVIEEEARQKAAGLVADADRRAASRTRQVEEWEQQVVAHTHAEQAYQARLHEEAEAAFQARMEALGEQHAEAVSSLTSVRDTLDRILEQAATSPLADYAPADPAEPADPAASDVRAAADDRGTSDVRAAADDRGTSDDRAASDDGSDAGPAPEAATPTGARPAAADERPASAETDLTVVGPVTAADQSAPPPDDVDLSNGHSAYDYLADTGEGHVIPADYADADVEPITASFRTAH